MQGLLQGLLNFFLTLTNLKIGAKEENCGIDPRLGYSGMGLAVE